ncbi:pirin family protein [Arenibacter sp. F20364]|uniref:pirin family protein n=1 Tax=Arenibacter sp. F20364 TaxID=2926415 RepID=UPI001FF45518|nr:pirin family protein [Arenibacter sp. F20364]MCK0189231.1 pirin family protein [Arenibacter sp. F20364]
MKTILHTAESRGKADHGWLNSYHSFSFANYHNPERMNFGVLRVLNDDTVSGGQGFGQHPHKNMEIISIPLKGDLEHKDSMGNTTVIKEGDVQVMSAGTGVFHSEYNKNKNEDVKFLQIWVFPKTQNVTPRYDQISTQDLAKKNSFYQILSPNKTDQGVWIHQDAWFSLGDFESGVTSTYTLNKVNNGLYLFVLEGNVNLKGQELKKRDGIGIWDTNKISITANSPSKLLVMEVPMEM